MRRIFFAAGSAALIAAGSASAEPETYTVDPRHTFPTYEVNFRDSKIPDDKLLVQGVPDSVSNFIEHPLLVAERIERFANIVGRDRVIAGTDCGFSTFAGFGNVDPEIVYAKLGALTEGAAIASKRLWGGSAA